MKRRNADIGKMRRPMKRNKITEGFYGSTLVYLKFIIIWILVVLADFILEFRFEFLWPFYLLLRSVYDSFKYQGLAFSIFFICIALTTDILCYFFIPINWLFFMASTYVWVQLVWQSEKGVCLPTILLWSLFIYLEIIIRFKDYKQHNLTTPHLNLCRPFASHCIGYPMVTLGFGFKSYIGYRIRQRKQRDVAKENEFYMQLIQQALPKDTILQQQQTPHESITTNNTTTTTGTTIINHNNNNNINNNNSSSSCINNNNNAIVPASQQTVQNNNNNNNNKLNNRQLLQQHERNGHIPNGTIINHTKSSHNKKLLDKLKEHDNEQHSMRQKLNTNNAHSHSNGVVVNLISPSTTLTTTTITNTSNTSATTITSSTQQTSNNNDDNNSTSSNDVVYEHKQQTRKRDKKQEQQQQQQDKEKIELNECIQKLEYDLRRLRNDLTNSRGNEQELRLQVAALTTNEKITKNELLQLQKEFDELQQKNQTLLNYRMSDKQTINNFERRLNDEKRTRCNLEAQLNQERKNQRKQQEEARTATAAAVAAAQMAAAAAAAQTSRGECTEQCKSRRRDLENELNDCLKAKHWAEERFNLIERENMQIIEQLRDTDILMSALNALQEKNSHLENSLSAETRIKLDLFSALGECKRQLELRESSNRNQEKEIEELKSKIAQVLAIMPNDTFSNTTHNTTTSGVVTTSPITVVNHNNNNNNNLSRVRLINNDTQTTTTPGSTLDPNATAYTPKNSLVVTSTEA